MDKLASLWSFVRKHKYLITLALFAVIIGFLDENSVVRRLGYAREESRLRDEQCGLDCHGRLLRRAVAHSGRWCAVCAGTGLVSGGQSGAGTKLLWRNLAVC